MCRNWQTTATQKPVRLTVRRAIRVLIFQGFRVTIEYVVFVSSLLVLSDREFWSYLNKCAGVMELVDVADSKSAGGDSVWVRVPPPAPIKETLDTSAFEASSVSFFIYALSTKMQGVLPCSLRVLSRSLRVLPYTFTRMPGSILTTLDILVADVLLDVVSRWA